MNLLIGILTTIVAFIATIKVLRAIGNRHRHDWTPWINDYPHTLGKSFYHRHCRTCGKPSRELYR